MSGINAILRVSSITKQDVEKLTRKDQPSVWHGEMCAMSSTSSVLLSKDQSLVMVCAGTIYNATYSDILDAYQQQGAACLDGLRGTFAIFIYDTRKRQLFVARDRVGEMPVYYTQIPGGLVVSSDLKSILQEYIPNPQINITGLLEPLRYIAPVDMENTWVHQIKRLQPGSYLEFDENNFNISQYWKRTRHPKADCTREEALAHTLELMQESVDVMMQGDKPIAIMLSGGVDSSAVAALAKRAGHEVHAFTIGFGGKAAYDERDIARRLAKEKGFEYNEIMLNPEDYEPAFNELMHYVDEPITDSAVIAQWMLYKKIHGMGYEVVLSGMGGDELFFNYAGLNMQAKARKLHHQFEQICPIDSFEKKKQCYRIMRAHWKALIMPQAWHMTNESSYVSWYNEPFKRFIADAKFVYRGREYKLEDYTPHLRYPECTIGSEIEQAYDDAIDRVMVGAYIYLGGIVSAANNLETRCPFLDYKLVDYVLHLPTQMVGEGKSFMKEALKDILPDYILNGKKRGFTPTTNYPQMVADKHNYQYIHTSAPFYPAAVADAMLTNLLSK